ncbi:MAG: UDP-N-acetylmuramoyl-tripeptide--D-alanyl-D-alanine ligase [bacterium]|nr:UDP-N-acetylmuramoyl-tripeptide--D-alanyl-D-alanine ligase [bacterium]
MRPTLSEIAARLGHSRRLTETPGWQARVDSREIKAGDLFIALPGQRQDGHAYIGDALTAGAAAVLAEEARLGAAHRDDPRLLAVPDPHAALLDLGALARDRHEGSVLAITGSNGKTTTKELLLAMLGGRWRAAGSQGNQNSTVGAPLSLLNALDGHELYVLEAGMSLPGEIARICAMARPTHGLITNIQPAHLEGTGGLEAVAREKGRLFQWLAEHDGTGIVNEDDPLVAAQARILRRRGSYSLRNRSAGAGIVMESVGVDEQARHLFRLSGHELRLPVPGQAFLACVAAATAAALELGLDVPTLLAGIAAFRGSAGRMQLRRGGGWTLLDDSYNANPASLEAALRTLAAMGGDRRVAVLGEMGELGGEAERLHRKCGRLAASLGLDLILLVGADAARAAYASGLREGGHPPDGQAATPAGLAALFTPRPGDLVLLKASRRTGLDALAREWIP